MKAKRAKAKKVVKPGDRQRRRRRGEREREREEIESRLVVESITMNARHRAKCSISSLI